MARKTMRGGKGQRTHDAHPGFAGASQQVAEREGIPVDRARAIIAAGAHKASRAAITRNPRLKRVSGAGRGY